MYDLLANDEQMVIKRTLLKPEVHLGSCNYARSGILANGARVQT